MGKRLIIAEKPSQAREYAKALGVRNKENGYFENEQYVITWCYGHLLELERPEFYMDLGKVGKRWSLRRLPILPKHHEFKRSVKASAENQYKVVQRLLKSTEVSEVICGTDADREGQLLFHEIWEASGCQKPLTRLWISSLTANAIHEGMDQLRSAQSVEGLSAAGNGRAYADWDFGMNLTEGFTSLFGSYDTVRNKPNVISIGRVQTPTLALIVSREWEIEQFVSKNYFEIRAEFETDQGVYKGKWFDPSNDSTRLNDASAAESIVVKTQGKNGTIIELTAKNVQEPAPLLFDLTSLSVTASKKFGFGAEKVLQLAQSLYEKKAITYPRTDCVYLSDDLKPKLTQHLQAIRQDPYINWVDEAYQKGIPQSKRVFNTITAHHAIIPTTEKVSINKLSLEEQKLYDLIVRRFLAVWLDPANYHQTDVVTIVEGEKFRTKGKVLLSPGWKKLYDLDDVREQNKSKSKKNDKNEHTDEEQDALPPLSKGMIVRTLRTQQEEKSTKPPKRFTQGDLLKAMESAGKQIDDEVLRQQLKGKGLGTVATRPAIIENIINRGYVIQDRKELMPTPKGVDLIRLIKDQLPHANLLISAEMTGQMEFDLSKVEKGELSLEHYMSNVEKAIIKIIEELRCFEQKYGRKTLALAPSVIQKKTRKVKNERGKQVQSEVKTATIKEVKEETIKNEKRSKIEGLPLGKCPNCGGDIIEGQKGFGCTNWRDGCQFVLWKTPICGKVLTSNQVKSLLKKGKTALIKGFKSKSGNSFAAHLIWEKQEEAKLKFEFK